MMALLHANPHDAVVLVMASMILPCSVSSFSIAMGNARPILKKRADYITKDVDKGGILYACRHFGWLPEDPAAPF